MQSDSNCGRVVIAGGNGFVGISLASHLTAAGWSVVVLSRNAPKAVGPWRHVAWDGRSIGDWCRELDGAAGIVNLAGRSVDCIKTAERQDEILRSRVESTRALGLAVRSIDRPPPVWVQMSTAHIYGDPPNAVCTEESPFGYGLAPFVGRAWEEECRSSALATQRTVIFRTSFVIGHDRGAGAGALTRLRVVTRLGLGGPAGSGNQGISWIHERDLNRLFERALTDRTMQGPYIASSPNPVSQRTFMRTLRRTMGIPIGLPAYEWMVRFGAHWLLRTDPELALCGRYVMPKRLLDEQFEFEFGELEDALGNLVGLDSPPRSGEENLRLPGRHLPVPVILEMPGSPSPLAPG
jgi:uncharacterized protein (TIGR01777 family)